MVRRNDPSGAEAELDGNRSQGLHEEERGRRERVAVLSMRALGGVLPAACSRLPEEEDVEADIEEEVEMRQMDEGVAC